MRCSGGATRIVPTVKHNDLGLNDVASSIARWAQDTQKLGTPRTSTPVRSRSRAQRPPKQNRAQQSDRLQLPASLSPPRQGGAGDLAALPGFTGMTF